MEDIYQMRLLPGTACETGHFGEKAHHENYAKFLPVWLPVAALWIPLR